MGLAPPATTSCLQKRRGSVLAKHAPQGVGDLPQRRVGTHGVDNHRHQVTAVTRRRLDLCERGFGRGLVTLSPHSGNFFFLPLLQGQIYFEELAVIFFLERKVVHANNDLLLVLDCLLVAERGLVDLALLVARLDRLDRTAQLVEVLDVLDRLSFQLVGEGLDKVRACQRRCTRPP